MKQATNNRQTAPTNVIILAKSLMLDKFVPTAHGTFGTIGDAERFAQGHFKASTWRVGKDTGRTNDSGETVYEYLSAAANPRRGYDA